MSFSLLDLVPYLIFSAALMVIICVVLVVKLTAPRKLAAGFLIVYVPAYVSIFLSPYSLESLLLIGASFFLYLLLFVTAVFKRVLPKLKGILIVSTFMMLDLYGMMQIFYFLMKS